MTAALLDLGASMDRVLEAMDLASGLGDVEVEVEETSTHGVRCLRTRVMSTDDEERGLDEVLHFLNSLELPENVVTTSKAVFETLGEAEEEVHGEALFHRVGAADAVADILGASTAFHDLGLGDAAVLAGPVSAGGGRTAEGYPVPGPATMEILRESELEWRGGPEETELLTPTGAALLAEFCSRSVDFSPTMVTEEIGVGQGAKELKTPNVLRLFLGRSRELSPDQICVLETAVDDATGEEVSYAVQALLDSGALDANVLNMGMKKGRTGYLVRVLSRAGEADELSELLVEELGTLGVRQSPIEHRRIAEREIREVELELGAEVERARVKVALGRMGRVLDVSAEYDDAERLAKKHDIPLRRVMKLVEDAV